jgi:hypothetical protein
MNWVVEYRLEMTDPPLGSAPADVRHRALARGESQTISQDSAGRFIRTWKPFRNALIPPRKRESSKDRRQKVDSRLRGNDRVMLRRWIPAGAAGRLLLTANYLSPPPEPESQGPQRQQAEGAGFGGCALAGIDGCVGDGVVSPP